MLNLGIAHAKNGAKVGLKLMLQNGLKSLGCWELSINQIVRITPINS